MFDRINHIDELRKGDILWPDFTHGNSFEVLCKNPAITNYPSVLAFKIYTLGDPAQWEVLSAPIHQETGATSRIPLESMLQFHAGVSVRHKLWDKSVKGMIVIDPYVGVATVLATIVIDNSNIHRFEIARSKNPNLN